MERNAYKLLPGLRWTGELRVLSVEPNGVAVEFDAEDPGGSERDDPASCICENLSDALDLIREELCS
jgi:hypothetical protein